MTDLNVENLSTKLEELNARESNVSEYNVPLSSKHKVCVYFSRYGYCEFGDECKYKHISKVREKSSRTFFNRSLILKNNEERTDISKKYSAFCLDTQVANDDKSSSKTQRTVKKYFSSQNRTYKKSTPLCYFYKKGKCIKGDDCKYYHQSRNTYSENATVKEQDKSTLAEVMSSVEPITDDKKSERFLKIMEVSNKRDSTTVSEENINQLRTTEIIQLKKRFPHAEELLGNEKFSFIFQPSDPDWPFDLRKITIEVCFPERYPLEKCAICVINGTENVPQLLIRFLNKAICEWVNQKCEENNAINKIELIFRPFLKWFDRNLEDLFIIGLRKVKQDLKAKDDGIEFIPPENLFPSSKENINSEASDNKECGTIGTSELVSSQLQLQPHKPISKASSPIKDKSNRQFHYIGNNIMKVLFSELELVEGAAALTCTKISVTLQCRRCKSSFHMKSVPKKNNVSVCTKCSKSVGLTFENNTVHQFSNVVGNLYLLDCVAMDMNLVESHFLVDCLNCSKQVSIDGIHYGQKHKMWCTFCNAKLLITIGSVKFQAIRLSSISDSKNLPVKKSEKKMKDPVIKEGGPLPNYGACKHYKKSFRWLRFPCCGRLYPCDECHNEKETDHEMKYASRMVCGYCSKEQSYSKEKPCQLCSQNLTKKSGCHWEGGKGCRNKIQMSREDKQKYASTCKTISKKAQNAKT